MFFLGKPNQQAISAFLTGQNTQSFSYAEVGCTRSTAPRRYSVDHNRIGLGTGRETFERAKLAIHQWKMFDIPWIQLCWPDTPIQPGSNVAVLVSHFGFWSLNACRIVYVVDELGAVERHGFAYGTLADHGEIGEERFVVEFNRADESVWYDLYAISRPNLAARLAYPLTRRLQKRFAHDSKAAMHQFTTPSK